MATLASLVVNIKAQTAQFVSGIKKAQAKTAAFRSSVNGLVSTLAGPVAAGAFLLFAKRALSSADSLAKTADKIGITVTKLQELRYVADRAGVSAMALDSSMERFTKRMGEAAQGTGEAIKVFEQFGISLTDVEGNMRDSESVFHDVMTGLASLESPAERAAAAAKVFGREGVAMVNMIKDGIVPMDEMIQRAHDLGIVLEEDVFRQAEAATDAITDMTYVLKAKFTVVVAKVLPFVIKSFTAAQLVVNGLKLAFFGLAWGAGKALTGLVNAWEWTKEMLSKGIAIIKAGFWGLLRKLVSLIQDVVNAMINFGQIAGFDVTALSGLSRTLGGFATNLLAVQTETRNATYQAQKFNDIYGIQAWAIEGVNNALRDNARLRKELGRAAPSAPRIGGDGTPPPPPPGGAGAGVAAEGDEWALGGPFGEAGTEVWLQESGIAMAALEAAWARHYANTEAIRTEARFMATDNESNYQIERTSALQEFLQSQLMTEQEHANAISNLRQESFDDMMGGLTSGMQEYMGALMKGQNAMKALKSVMIATAADTVAGIAEKWGRFYFLEGAVKLAASIYPPNPGQAASGLAEMAAGGALMALGGAVRAGAASVSGGGGGAAGSAAAGTPFGAAGAPGGAAAGAEDEGGAGGLVVNIHVEGHIVDEQKFLEEVVMPNMAKAVGRGAANDGQFNMISERD